MEVAAGLFWMGTDAEDLPARFAEINEIYRSRNTDWFIADETPMHEVSLPTCYVARYPVTVGWFMAFLAEEDFRRLLRRPSLRPYTLRPGTQQMVFVTWFESMLYCDGLMRKLWAWAGTPEPLATLLREGADGSGPWRVTLPPRPSGRRPRAARTAAAFPGATSRMPATAATVTASTISFPRRGFEVFDPPVGCFPRGASPYGIQDTTAVYEWTRTLYQAPGRDATYGYSYGPAEGHESLDALLETSTALARSS